MAQLWFVNHERRCCMTDLLKNLTAGEITLIVAVIGLGSAIFGATIGASSALLASHLTRRSEERRHYRELGVSVARAKFDQSMEFAQKAANTTGQIIFVPPFDAHLIHGIRLMEIISDSRLSAQQVGERIAALTDFTTTVTNTVKNKQ